MSMQPHCESSVFGFVDSFLQEKNIKWVLTTGLLILLGSSLMMVLPQWDTFGPTWKFLTLVGYTGAIFATGWWSYHKLALRRTGTTLLALTVLLIPVSFMAWHWTWSTADSVPGSMTSVVLLGLNFVLAAIASHRTFRHFLHGDQPTFVVSYLILSLAGAVGPGLRDCAPVWSWLVSIGLWGVFSVGVVKVNRHVFWLTEERRQPRVFGFFPILLLGGQFSAVFAANLASVFSVEWLGFGCVLVAIPTLLTAETVAKVFQERTGNVVRPIPWPIMLPFTIGLLLCVTGVVVAGTVLPQRAPFALVPTAALAASLMAVTAKRTNHVAFVWAMLFGIVLTYNFSPVFFQSAARAAISRGAAAVQEARLPYAFYGLTYLPLVLAMSGIAAYANRLTLFARPLQQFSVGISCVLLAVSVGHVKALLPVAAAMFGVFALQARLFRDRRLAVAALIAYLIAAAGSAPFVERVFAVPLPANAMELISLVAAAVLLVTGPWLDSQLQRIPVPGFNPRSTLAPLWTSMGRTMSLIATVLITVAWMVRPVTTLAEAAPFVSLLAVGLLAAHSLVWMRPAVSWFTYVFAIGEFLRITVELRVPMNAITSLATVLLLAQWALTYVFVRRPDHRVSRAWSEVNKVSAWAGLLLLSTLVAAPDLVRGNLNDGGSLSSLIRSFLLVVWCFDASRHLESWLSSARERFAAQSAMTICGCLGVLGSVSSCLVLWQGVEAQQWIPLAWAATANAALPLVVALRRRWSRMDQEVVLAEDYHTCGTTTQSIEAVLYLVFGSLAALHLLDYSTSIRLAGYLGIGGLLAMAFLREQPLQRQVAIGFANWAIILAVAQWCAPQVTNLIDFLQADLGLALWCVAALSSGSLLLWATPRTRILNYASQFADMQRAGLRVACFGSLLFTLDNSQFPPFAVVLAGCAFVFLIATEISVACRSRDVSRVWGAEILGALACGYFAWFRVISFGRGWSMFVILGIGVLLHLIGEFASRRPRIAILSRPFSTTGLWMPVAAVAVGVFRHLSQGDQVVWQGMNSLAILLVGGFYFWQAIERRSTRFTLLSAAILNIALILLWRELTFSDPQFYLIPVGISLLALVQILRREIPIPWHDPLRYAGALTILVSPTFHIVHGSWLHLFSLMIASTTVLLLAIGTRVRALMYTGVGFLIADLCGMVVCGSIDQPNVLWIAGIGFGAAIVALGATCEHNREKLLQRLRIVSAQLEHWD